MAIHATRGSGSPETSVHASVKPAGGNSARRRASLYLAMRHSIFAILVISLLSTPAFAQTTRPIPQIERMVIISIDGCRPDLLLRADCPNVRTLVKDGAFSFWARTTAVSITLPSHVSMLTGVTPQKHGIVWNEDLPLQTPIYPKYPTIFELAHAAGYTTALISGK